MKYCTRCVMPHSKPYSRFNDEGVCSACLAHDQKQHDKEKYDWKAKEAEFAKLVAWAKAKKAPFYDVVVPVSGGKDSIFQVHTALKYGLRVAAVNVDYGIKTDIGKHNLSCIPRMGAALITYTPESRLHKELIRKGFEDYGDPDLMSHGLLYAYPHWFAVQFDVPLVLWGENPAFEYGGDSDSAEKTMLDRDWFIKHVMTQQMTVEKIATRYNLPVEQLKLYDFPAAELKAKGIKSTFLGCYFFWDSERNLEVSRQYGFKELSDHREGTFRKYVGVDEKINRIHQYMKVLKFGYGRCTDHVCEEIRNGRMTRAEGIAMVKKYDLQPLGDYYVDDYCTFLGYTKKRFSDIIDSFRNLDVWAPDNDGEWHIKGWIGDEADEQA